MYVNIIMKRKLIVLLYALFALAGIGLIVIQVIQTNRTAAMSNNLFTISVNNAMDDVIDELNRMKIEDYISQNDRYKLLKYKRIEDINNRMKDVVRENADLFFDDERVHTNVALQDSVIPIAGARLSSGDSAAINTYNSLLFNRNKLTRGDDYYDRFVTELSAYVIDNLMTSSTFNYELLNDIIVEELVDNGVDIKPNMGVISSNSNDFLYCNNEDKKQEILASPYRYSFHPSGMNTANEYYIVLQFPTTLLFLNDSNKIFMVMSIILIFIIFVLFSVSFRTILKQRKLDEMKNDFISNMTHEIKTPLTNIGLACEMLQIPEISQSQENLNTYLTIINDENRRMRVLIESILRSSKMSSKNFNLNLQETDIHTIIDEAAKSFKMQVANRQGSLTLNLNAQPSNLTADSFHLSNMMYNLIDNAIKYSPEKVEISISTESQNNNIVIRVSDKGLGISDEDQKHIFEKFYRVSTGNVHNVKGFGIGLSYVEQVVAHHDGHISIESELGQGSTFIITLPRQ